MEQKRDKPPNGGRVDFAQASLVLPDCRRNHVLRRDGQVGQGLRLGRTAGLDGIADRRLWQADGEQRPGFECFAKQSAVIGKEVLSKFGVEHGNTLSLMFRRVATP